MISANIQAVDAGMKDVNIIVYVDDVSITVSTPFEKITIPRKELEKLMQDKAEVKADVKVEDVVEKKWTRKENSNA